MQYIIDRLREASTWAGIAIFLGMFGLDGDMISRLTANAPAVMAGIAALIAIVAPSFMSREAIRTNNERVT